MQVSSSDKHNTMISSQGSDLQFKPKTFYRSTEKTNFGRPKRKLHDTSREVPTLKRSKTQNIAGTSRGKSTQCNTIMMERKALLDSPDLFLDSSLEQEKAVNPDHRGGKDVTVQDSPDLFSDSGLEQEQEMNKGEMHSEMKSSASTTPVQVTCQDGESYECKQGGTLPCRTVSDTESVGSISDSVSLLSMPCLDGTTERSAEIPDVENKLESPKKQEKKLFPIFNTSRSPSSSSNSSPLQNTKLNAVLTPRNSPRLALNVLKPSPQRSPRLLKKSQEKDGKEQMIMDAGQKIIGVTQCPKCGMTYTLGDPDDEATHSKFHQRTLNALKFPGWKKERVVQEFLDGSRIIVVLPDEKPEKINEIRKVMDEDLGFSENSPRANSKVFLYISGEKRVIGCCLAELISAGYRVIPEKAKDKENIPSQPQRPWCCRTEPERAKCGINRIWVLKSERRRGIATKLLNSARMHFVMGMAISRELLAFSDPTPDGRQLATKYMGTQSFLVYKLR